MPALENPRHETFAQTFAAGKKAADAYLAAGYEVGRDVAVSAGSRLLADVKIRARIDELRSEIAAVIVLETGITEARIMRELALIGFANMNDFIKIGSDGDPYTDFTGLDAERAAAIGELTVEDFKEGRGDMARDVRRVKFKLMDKRAALVDMGRHLGMFKERVDIGGKVEVETMPVGELARTIALILRKGADKA